MHLYHPGFRTENHHIGVFMANKQSSLNLLFDQLKSANKLQSNQSNHSIPESDGQDKSVKVKTEKIEFCIDLGISKIGYKKEK